MTAPTRVQLRRTRGWRKPVGTIVVARPSKWGNIYAPIRETSTGTWRVTGRTPNGLVLLAGHEHASHLDAISDVVNMYRSQIMHSADDDELTPVEYLAELRGHDLACWCPLDQPCHADVLIELANA